MLWLRLQGPSDVLQGELSPFQFTQGSNSLHKGVEGCYFVNGDDSFTSFGKDKSIVDYNKPPTGQSGLYCQWVPSTDNSGIEWDNGEKFYEIEIKIFNKKEII